MKALKNSASKHMFLFIAVAISLYFGAHGYLFLNDPNRWNWPWFLAGSTIFLIEIIWLNVFRAKTYANWVTLMAGIVAVTFCVFLPLYASWSDFRGLQKEVAVTIELSAPEYNEDKVIPALDSELEALEALIAPRIAERERRFKIGDGVYEKRPLVDGTFKIITGFKAASWVPYGKKERSDFRRVEELRKEIRQKREEDKRDRNLFKIKQESRKGKIAGIQADLTDGRDSLLFKGAMIIILAAFSLYYMYSYNNPEQEKFDIKDSALFDQQNFKMKRVGSDEERIVQAKLVKKKVVKSKAMQFVLDHLPDAESVISEDKLTVSVVSGGEVIGSSSNAPNAWRASRKEIERFLNKEFKA